MENREKYVVVPDLHGHDSLLAETHKRYGDIGYVILGDVVDGPRVKETFDIIADIDAHLTLGNHDWAMMAAIFEISPTQRIEWANNVWLKFSGSEQTLASYGVANMKHDSSRLGKLGQKLFKLGHLDILHNATTYFEDDTVIGVHAGITNRPWEKQKQELAGAEIDYNRNRFDSEPIQLFDHNHRLSMSSLVPEITDKKLITGHSSLAEGVEGRITDGGRRVRLGSRLYQGAPLYVWESWSQQVRAITLD